MAGLIVLFSAFRFIVCYFTVDKRLMLLFLFINILIFIFNFSEIYDLIFLVIIYNFIIFSPIAVFTEIVFLTSNIVWYIRFYKK